MKDLRRKAHHPTLWELLGMQVLAMVTLAILAFGLGRDDKDFTVTAVMFTFGPLAVGVLSFVVFPAVGFKCPHCGKHLSTFGRWVCGPCDRTNLSLAPRSFSFLDRCLFCLDEPDAYACEHCGGLVVFFEKADLRHPARRRLSPAKRQALESKRSQRLVWEASLLKQQLEAEARLQANRQLLIAEQEEERKRELRLIALDTQRLQAEAERAAAQQRLARLQNPPSPANPIETSRTHKLAAAQNDTEWLDRLDAARLAAEAKLRRTERYKSAGAEEREQMLQRLRGRFNPGEFDIDL